MADDTLLESINSMILNKSKKYVFIAVPKTAGTTITRHLMDIDEAPPKNYIKQKFHWPIHNINTRYQQPDYFKFGFVRNPWDRMVSSWFDFAFDPTHLFAWNRDIRGREYNYLFCYNKIHEEFKTFENFIMNFKNTEWGEDVHFQTATWYLWNEQRQEFVDFIGRYENLEKDFNYCLKKIGHKSVDLSNMKKWRKTNRTKKYQPYYTNKQMIEQIAKLFEDDLKNFGYVF